MSVSFLPKIITDAVTDLTPEFLHSLDIRLLMMDFDNTIVPYTTNIPTAAVDTWLKLMAASDIQLCIKMRQSRKRRWNLKIRFHFFLHNRNRFPLVVAFQPNLPVIPGGKIGCRVFP